MKFEIFLRTQKNTTKTQKSSQICHKQNKQSSETLKYPMIPHSSSGVCIYHNIFNRTVVTGFTYFLGVPQTPLLYDINLNNKHY